MNPIPVGRWMKMLMEYISHYIKKKDYKAAKHQSGLLKNVDEQEWEIAIQTYTLQCVANEITRQLRSLPAGGGGSVDGLRADLKAILLRLDPQFQFATGNGGSRDGPMEMGAHGDAGKAGPAEEGEPPMFPDAVSAFTNATSFDVTNISGDGTHFADNTMPLTMPPPFI
jgi:hypothetical protein